ncbi:MAG TPA: VWA domain-containing protein [Acidobacteriaceae bacterium]|jgi:VWFA-related protein|nr:VWA domain-containing protein [Acidobacteriaceae bacterium]
MASALLAAPFAVAQNPPPAPPPAATPTFSTQSTLVVVPTMVTTKAGEPVFTLSASDFTVTDDGKPQKITVEDNGGQPLALVVVVETGGDGARQLGTESPLVSMLDTIAGGVPHQVAVVAFDSVPRLAQPFTPNLETAENTLRNLNPGDPGAAILDALTYAVNMLRNQPPEYRRAIFLVSETLDHGSHVPLEDALRAVSDSNTAIYTLSFSSTRADMKTQSSLFVQPNTPGPAHGCMAKDPDNPERTPGQTASQLYDCLSLLAPPLRAIKMATIAGMNSLHRDIPETVAHMTGGEFYRFHDPHTMERDLVAISNHVPNRYLISFHPQSPHPGLHTLAVRLRQYPKLEIRARANYWIDEPPAPSTPPASATH